MADESPKILSQVYALIRNPETHELLMVRGTKPRKFNHETQRSGYWRLPGGDIWRDESMSAAIRNRTYFQTGLSIDFNTNDDLLYKIKRQFDPPQQGKDGIHIAIVFAQAKDLTAKPQPKDKNYCDAKWVSYREALAMFQDIPFSALRTPLTEYFNEGFLPEREQEWVFTEKARSNTKKFAA